MQNQCPKHTHIDHIQYRCALEEHDTGDHNFTQVVPLEIEFDGLDTRQIESILSAANQDLAIYTPEDIRRALWLALNELITEHTDDLSLLLNSEYEKYLDLVYDRWDKQRKQTLREYDSYAFHFNWLPRFLAELPCQFAEPLNDAVQNCDLLFPDLVVLATRLRAIANVMPSQWQEYDLFGFAERKALDTRDFGVGAAPDQYEYARDGFGDVFDRRLKPEIPMEVSA